MVALDFRYSQFLFRVPQTIRRTRRWKQSLGGGRPVTKHPSAALQISVFRLQMNTAADWAVALASVRGAHLKRYFMTGYADDEGLRHVRGVVLAVSGAVRLASGRVAVSAG